MVGGLEEDKGSQWLEGWRKLAKQKEIIILHE